jgi:hypothetical protein
MKRLNLGKPGQQLSERTLDPDHPAALIFNAALAAGANAQQVDKSERQREMNPSSKRSKENMFAHVSSSPERGAAIEEVVGKMPGTIPMKEPLPDQIPALERIKIYA